jgi:hypothetical protein
MHETRRLSICQTVASPLNQVTPEYIHIVGQVLAERAFRIQVGLEVSNQAPVCFVT